MDGGHWAAWADDGEKEEKEGRKEGWVSWRHRQTDRHRREERGRQAGGGGSRGKTRRARPGLLPFSSVLNL